ncbi:hypothetical protein AWENTII_001409 [Aspergillus wentii]
MQYRLVHAVPPQPVFRKEARKTLIGCAHFVMITLGFHHVANPGLEKPPMVRQIRLSCNFVQVQVTPRPFRVDVDEGDSRPSLLHVGEVVRVAQGVMTWIRCCLSVLLSISALCKLRESRSSVKVSWSPSFSSYMIHCRN